MNRFSPLHNRIDDLIELGHEVADDVNNMCRHRSLKKEVVDKSLKPFFKVWRKQLRQMRKNFRFSAQKLNLKWELLRLRLLSPRKMGNRVIWWRPLGFLYQMGNALLWLGGMTLKIFWFGLALFVVLGFGILILRLLISALFGGGGTP